MLGTQDNTLRKAEIHEKIGNIDKAVEELGSILGALKSRLSPILQNKQPVSEKPMATSPSVTAVGQNLQNINDKIISLTGNIQELLNTLEI